MRLIPPSPSPALAGRIGPPGPPAPRRPRRHRAHHRLLTGLVLGATGLAAAAVTLPGVGGPGGLEPAAAVVLPADVLPGLAGLAGTPAPAGQVLHLGVALAPADPAAEAAEAAAVSQPGNPAYEHFLTPGQVAADYGPPTTALDAVTSWLRGGGLSVTEVAAGDTWVQAAGTVQQIEALVHSPIEQFRSGGTSFLANTAAPTVPAGAGVVSVVGLNTLQRFSTPAAPATGTCLPSCVYGPRDLWSLYDMPASDGGQGRTMAVIAEGDPSTVPSDLRAFESANDLPAVALTVDEVGAGPFTDTSGTDEWDLDSQASTGVAPDVAGETMYFASSFSDADMESALAAWVSDPNGPAQADASWGECEQSPLTSTLAGGALGGLVASGPVSVGDDLEGAMEQTLEQATLEGRTLFAAAGDTGSSCPVLSLPGVGAGNGLVNQVVPLLNYPCASRYAVCVGGTELYSDGGDPPTRQAEIAWAFTGGGSSPFLSEPWWQQPVTAVDHPCLVQPDGTAYPSGTVCRGVPDVSAMSGDVATNAFSVVVGGQPTATGGTSLSSPLWMGVWTRVQAASATGLGFADPVLYAVGLGQRGDAARDFHDITVGTNGLYTAAPGWDYVSGWGSPDVANLVADLDGTLTPQG